MLQMCYPIEWLVLISLFPIFCAHFAAHEGRTCSDLSVFQTAMDYSDQAHNFDKSRPSRKTAKVSYVLENLPPGIRPSQHSSAWQIKNEDRTFYGEIKRALFVLRILGVLPYSTTSTGKSNFTHIQYLLNVLKRIAWKFYTYMTSNSFSI